MDYDWRAQIDKEKICERFDENIITVGAKCHRHAEVLFQPSFIGKEASGLLSTLFQNVMKCDVNSHRELYATVVVSGGTDLFQGLIEHMSKEPMALVPLTVDFTEVLMQILIERGFSFSATAEKEIARVVIETLCHMRFGCDTGLKSTAELDKEKTYVFPDGNIITVPPTASVSQKCCSSQISS